MPEPRYEYCCICTDPTGRAGRADDSIYRDLLKPYGNQSAGDEIGPLCDVCLSELVESGCVDDE